MKNNNTNILSIILGSIIFFLLTLSCEEEKLTNNFPDQLFRPVSFGVGLNGTQTTFSWIPIGGATYLLEISRDSLLFQNDFQSFQLGVVDEFIVTDLWSNSRYSARIKSISSDGVIKDSEYKIISFITGTENIFYLITSDNIYSDQILLKWDKSKTVSKIIVSSVGSTDITYALSSAEIQEGKKLITGLSSKKTYSFKIYLGEMVRGTINATTK